jgi:hypothetical protein
MCLLHDTNWTFNCPLCCGHCSMIFVIYMLLLPEGKTGEAWESGGMGRKSTFTSWLVHIIVVDKKALWEVFLLVLRSSTVFNISPVAPYVSSFTCCPYQKDKRDKPGNLPIWDVLSEVGEYCIESYFQLFHFWIELRTLRVSQEERT